MFYMYNHRPLIQVQRQSQMHGRFSQFLVILEAWWLWLANTIPTLINQKATPKKIVFMLVCCHLKSPF